MWIGSHLVYLEIRILQFKFSSYENNQPNEVSKLNDHVNRNILFVPQ